LVLCVLSAWPQLAEAEHWVSAWATAQEDYQSLENDQNIGERPFVMPLRDQTARMTLRVALGGHRVRVRLSNELGDESVVIGAASFAINPLGPRVEGRPLALTFGGRRFVSISGRTSVTSDPLSVSVAPGQEVSVSLYFPNTTPIFTSHSMGSLASRMFLAPGNFAFDTTGKRYTQSAAAWVFLSSVEVDSDVHAFGIALLGDSITDGQGVNVDNYERWGDVLEDRLIAVHIPASVVNLGIDGDRVLNPTEPTRQDELPYKFGASAITRVDRDVLEQQGLRYLVVFLGINDIGMHYPTVTATDIINGYRKIVERAHAAGLRVYGCTLTPAIGTLPVGTLWSFDSKEEAVRIAVNAELRKGGIFDYVVDFDALARDPDNPSRYRADLTEDHLHPNRTGAQILGQGIPLSLFVDGVRSPRHADNGLP